MYRLRHFSKLTVVVFLLQLYSNTNGLYQHRLYVRSITDLKYLENFELQIAQSLTQISVGDDSLNNNPQVRRMVELYLQDFFGGCGLRNMKDVFSMQQTQASKNPICTYKLIRRVAFLLKDLVSHKYFSTTFYKLSSQVQRFFVTNGWPNIQEVEDAITSIIRIQHVYDLKSEDLANGWISAVQTNCTLNSIHCYEIANTASKIGHHTWAMEWLELAKVKTVVDGKLDVPLVGSAMWNVIEKHNEGFETANSWETKHFDRVISLDSDDYKRAQKRRTIQYNAFKGKKDKRYAEINYWGLCAGQSFQSDKEKAHLFCWYEFKAHSSFSVGPIKMEFLARDPDVVQMYEVIYDNEIQGIISESVPRLKNSLVVNTDPDNITNTKDEVARASIFRTSVSSWFDDFVNATLSKRVERLTGLFAAQRTAAEMLQIASYSFAGHYVPHVDSLMSPKEMGANGERIATFMFYFNDVELGGGTAFTTAGVVAKPRKGSAVFWYDIYTDHSPDQDTYHGACPILLGEKWVGNKWIRVKDQLLVRKCSLNQKERFQIPVNKVYLPIPKIPKEETQRKSTESKSVNVATNKLNKYSYLTPHGLKALAELEWEIYQAVQQFCRNFSDQSRDQMTQKVMNFQNDVKMYLEDFEETNLQLNGLELVAHNPAKRAEKIAWNPLASYHMIARFMVYVQPWLNASISNGLTSYISRIYKPGDGPDRGDFNAAMFAIMNIHYLYGLSAKDIAAGYVAGVNTNIVLKATDCFLIGKFAVKRKYFTIGIEWLEHALHLVETKSDETVDYDDVHVELITAAIVHDEEHAKTKGYEPKFFNKPLKEVSEPQSRVTRKTIQYNAFKNKIETNFVNINFWGICEGKSHQMEEEKSYLFCWYESKIHPSFLISPIKSEIHSVFPKIEVVQYYDLISDATIDALKKFTYAGLVRASTAQNGDHDRRKIDSEKRQSIHAWISEKDLEEALKVSKLIERITDLKVVNTKGDDLQIAAYTPGSYYTVHTDTGSVITEGKPSRIATFMFYLSDVEKGGDTAFVQAGVKVEPKKGSAVFWYNLIPSGDLEDLTWHGACPVIFGEKWVANKWIHYQNQQHLQCGTNRFAAFEILVNGESKYT